MTEPQPVAPQPAKRSKRTRNLMIAAIALVLVVAGVWVGSRLYAAHESSKAAAAPSLSLTATPEASSSSTAGSAGAGSASGSTPEADLNGTWSISTGSFAGYRVAEVLNGADVTVTGRTEDVSGEVTVAGQRLTAASLTLNVASITTDSTRRDDYFRTSAINTSQYPEATFKLTEAVDVSAAANGGSQEFTIKGDLTLNGTTVPVTATVNGAFTGTSAQVVGHIDVTWQDFGVQAPNLGFVSVQDSGQIEFSMNLAKG
jgi:polyisoprenoid-binding protein YceI